MSEKYKKTFIGSVVAFVIGTSCCWMSSIAIWVGGATILTTIASYIGKVQYFLITVGILLSILSLILYIKYRKNK